MSQTVKRMKCKRCREDGLASIFDTFWKSGNEFDDVCTAKGFWSDKVRNRESVEHYLDINNSRELLLRRIEGT